jgi:hypothetical protein
MTNPKPTADAASYEEQTDEEMIAEIAAAHKAGTLRRGGLDVPRTPPSELEQQLGGLDERPTAPTIPVTVRMPAAMVAALKERAQHEGLRGYQTLMKRWIEERLAGERVISARDVESALGQLHSAESTLERLLK